ncbi:hypothetical protein DY000_02010286 [Brassica cretica]|uniref:Secreted protein n=1 Tax=Brassica cretica TaxID=69181 RepID=A0ABQ7CD58_BRACR|nr:hypothetical protein DY000_02010286 [Brassica cretica]
MLITSTSFFLSSLIPFLQTSYGSWFGPQILLSVLVCEKEVVGTETWRRVTSELSLFTITGRWNLHNPPEICTVTINPRTPNQNPLHLPTNLFALRERR